MAAMPCSISNLRLYVEVQRIRAVLCATPWILIEVCAFAPNQMESGVLGYHFRSKNGSIGWVHAWGKSFGAVGIQERRWTPAAGADVVNQVKIKCWFGHTPRGPVPRPWRYRRVFDKDPNRPCPSPPMRLQSRKLGNILRFR